MKNIDRTFRCNKNEEIVKNSVHDWSLILRNILKDSLHTQIFTLSLILFQSTH